MKYAPSILPFGAWGQNARQFPKVWKKIREAAIYKADHRCEVCGAEGRVECHEEWSFDAVKRIQRLEQIKVLCPACHETQHTGRARMLGRMEQVVAHICKINSISQSEAIEAINSAVERAVSMNDIVWSLDIPNSFTGGELFSL